MKKYLKFTYKTIIIYCIAMLILLYPMPYYISSGGGISDINEKFTIENGYKSEGSFNLSYVSQLDATVSSYIMSFFMPNWEREKVEEYQVTSNETAVDINNRGKIQLQRANQNGVLLAYKLAGKTVNIKDTKYYVGYILNEQVKKIKVGDILYKVNDKEVVNFDEVRDAAKKYDKVKITVKRDDKIIDETIESITDETDNSKYLGLAFFELFDYELEPKIEFKFDANEYGSSAGFMTTLAVYNTLIPEDLTHGLKIAGTGTILDDGTVGEIGGVNYKLIGAVYGNADIFFVPSGDNYEDAMKLKKEMNYKIEIVEVKNINDAIKYLENLKK